MTPRTFCLFVADDFREDEHWRMEDHAREGQQSPPQQQSRAVDEQQETLDGAIGRALDLVIGDAHVPEESVVRDDALAKLDDAWFVLVVEVSFHEALAELDDLSQSEVLPGDTVQSTSRLNNLCRWGQRLTSTLPDHNWHRSCAFDPPASSPNPVLGG
jgi:hypothetical protein